MKYNLIHDKFIEYFRNTTPKSRLIIRNKNDKRLNLKYLYVEIHHILPRSLGGTDDFDNLVEVLPEEHIFLHMLRYKIFKTREDMLAVRFCLNGVDNNQTKLGENFQNISLNKKVRMGYAWLRTHSYNFRKEIGWQTIEGLQSISESRKDKMPVKCSITGEVIGSVSNNHPNILSGLWVHTSKGRQLSEEEKENKSSPGFKNPNSNKITKNELINFIVEYSIQLNRIPCYKELKRLVKKDYNIIIPSSHNTFRFTKDKSIYDYAEEKTGLKFNKYYKDPNINKKISKTLTGTKSPKKGSKTYYDINGKRYMKFEQTEGLYTFQEYKQIIKGETNVNN